jgi:hypothetical protein
MEEKMKAICEGRTTRAAVVQETLEQYRAVYARTEQRMDLLKAVRTIPDVCSPLCADGDSQQSIRRYVLGQRN